MTVSRSASASRPNEGCSFRASRGRARTSFRLRVEKFGRLVAERTFSRVRRFLLESLAAFPRIGVYRSGRDIYEVVIPRTPFIAFYRIDASADVLTVVAFFHYAQDRASEWRGDKGRA